MRMAMSRGLQSATRLIAAILFLVIAIPACGESDDFKDGEASDEPSTEDGSGPSAGDGNADLEQNDGETGDGKQPPSGSGQAGDGDAPDNASGDGAGLRTPCTLPAGQTGAPATIEEAT